MIADPLKRFSSRVENYIRYRPSYPPTVIELLREKCNLTAASIVADIGSGTGILSEMFLRNGNLVYGVEPNREMREAGERLLAAYSNFKSIEGAAEATTLEGASVDFVTAGQAFHWFRLAEARAEFARILKPGGWVVLIWNERRTEGTPFLKDYERLLQTYGTDYQEVTHKYGEESPIGPFFSPQEFHTANFENQQVFDFESLRGRLLSASYTPEAGHPNYQPMLDELERIFQLHQTENRIVVEYDTNVYYGHLTAG